MGVRRKDIGNFTAGSLGNPGKKSGGPARMTITSGQQINAKLIRC